MEIYTWNAGCEERRGRREKREIGGAILYSRSPVEVGTQDFLEPAVSVECEAEEV